MKKLSKTDAAYLAGIIDGEGSIVVSKVCSSKSAKACKRGFSYRAYAMVSMVDRSTIDWIKKTVGLGQVGKASKPPEHHRQAWRWTIWSRQASFFLQSILPYLRLKKPNAKNLISFQKDVRHRYPVLVGLSDQEWYRREQHHKTSLRLNKRGC